MISIDYFRKMESSIVEMAFYEITFSVVSYSHLLYFSSVSESIEFLRRDHWEKEIERRRPYETGYVKLKEWLHKQHRHIHIHLDFQDFIENMQKSRELNGPRLETNPLRCRWHNIYHKSYFLHKTTSDRWNR